MSRVKALLKDSMAYGVASILSRFIGFLLMPLYTRILTPEDYGVLNIINITITLVTLFSVLGLDGATHIFYWDNTEEEKRKSVFSSWYWSQLSISLVIAAALFAFSVRLSLLLFKSAEHANMFRLASLILITGILPSVVINWFRIRRLPWTTTWFSLAMALITIGLNVWFIAGLRWGVKGFILAQIISGSVMSVVAMYFMRGWLSPLKLNYGLLKQMLKYSLPLIPAALAYWCLNFAGSYFLQVQRGEGEVGLYQTGSTIASIMMLIISSFTSAWGPYAMSVKNEDGANRFYAQVLILYVSGAGVFAAGIGIFAHEILYFLTTPSYWTAHNVAAILAFNSVLTGLNFIAALGLNFVKNMKPYSLAIITGAVVNLCLFYISIEMFGKEGCALAILLTNIGVTFWIFRSAQKAYYIPYNFTKAITIFLSCVSVVLISRFIDISSIWLSIGLKSVLGLLLITVIFYLNKTVFFQIVNRFKRQIKYNTQN
jgi:O-antigen/teichoic acid export membrane protein